MKVTRAEEVAWAAGFFEGEGSITESNGPLITRITNTDESMLQRFRDAVDAGRTLRPVRPISTRWFNRKPVFVWHAAEEAALDVLELLGPWLSARRLQRAYELTGLRFHGI